MKRIAVLTSGGDAPGMNAAIRAVVRTGVAKGFEVFGVKGGYEGLINGRFIPMGTRDVGGMMQRGGTMLGSARSEEFKTEKGQLHAIRSLNETQIEGLVVIGGNGSQTGSLMLHRHGFPVVGVASTIDNDLYGCDVTIGVDTALNIALEAIDRLKTTASSHQRAFLIEVMGRKCGYLALMAAIAGGAESVVLPEIDVDPEHIAEVLTSAYEKGKEHAIIVVAEGAKFNANALDAYFTEHRERLGFDLRVTILGHTQRGGIPSAYDRILGSRLGAAAVEQMAKGNYGVLVGEIKDEIATTPLEEVVNNPKELDRSLIDLAKVLD
ncbi:MAG: 6-phosphofructokinase [Chloroflexi bacterium HGW-Chloroflexi-4]|jgi:6-phosphofructokinase 1|nr:MAG: 6-phosphofructokinase [Chloroflexi bacterium HGW-Chloroflexi-4]